MELEKLNRLTWTFYYLLERDFKQEFKARNKKGKYCHLIGKSSHLLTLRMLFTFTFSNLDSPKEPDDRL
jgi:hypothetical protein